MKVKRKKKTTTTKKRIRALGVVAGNGVILHPFKEHLIGNIENRKVFRAGENDQWYLNFDVPLVNDTRVAGYLFKNVDVIVGSPDCGHSSVLGFTAAKVRKNPQDNDSVRLYFNSILKYKPKIWIMENLPALLNSITQTSIKDQFPDYRVIFHIASVSEFGNSQKSRKRLLIVAIRRDLPADAFMEFSEVNRIKKPKKINSILEGLGEDDRSLCHIRESEDKAIKMGNKSYTFGEIAKRWNKELKGECYWDMDQSSKDSKPIPGVYRLIPEKYPQTVRQDPRQFRPDGKPMSPRELGRIQGLPDTFKLLMPEEPDENGDEYYLNKARITVAKGAPYELGEWIARKLAALTHILSS